MAITADTATIQQAAQDTQTAKDDISGKLTQLRGAMENLGAGWGGQAAASFGRVMEAFDKEGQDLMTALESIAEMLRSTGVAIQENEDAANDAMGKFSIL
ncbi:WXG100 family type VII secretion target [Phytomonospora sp. NPDC050363]|uniref:WXG100 family type VII secretion target n=1 Tax=Phytomonospora sp. NPDC050363 TaxID=3155642 RepID=UPI0033D4A845